MVTFASDNLAHDSAHDLIRREGKSVNGHKTYGSRPVERRDDAPLEGETVTHLAGTRLREIGDEVDLLGRSERSDDLANLEDELLGKGRLILGLEVKFTRNSRKQGPNTS